MLKNSAISRLNRSCKVRISGNTVKSKLQGATLAFTENQTNYAMNIVDEIQITAVIETYKTSVACQTVDKLRDFILALPRRFD